MKRQRTTPHGNIAMLHARSLKVLVRRHKAGRLKEEKSVIDAPNGKAPLFKDDGPASKNGSCTTIIQWYTSVRKISCAIVIKLALVLSLRGNESPKMKWASKWSGTTYILLFFKLSCPFFHVLSVCCSLYY